ncbi:hypothetical protein DVK44_20770 [Streptomyces paludis]|uniref:Uncharacterized protein n=2 Tax=Streptomyces paludis TaxID=2282738 RepID=A0A345I1G0_9ACTN|nr:hypothetical protein DVK44_20770 [Streptomyces paludis]
MSDNGINDPLPRMSKVKAEEWARHWTESMARTAKAEIQPETDPELSAASFTHCVGERDEVAGDGRFTLRYSVRAKLPKKQHAQAIRAIRDTLKRKGFEIVGYRSDASKNPANLVDAKHPEDHQAISAEDIDDSLLVLIVNTPCLLPPGVSQQQF